VLNDQGEKLAEIKEIYQPSQYISWIDLGMGEKILTTDPDKKQLDLKITLWGEISDNQFYYNGKVLKFDKVLEIDFPDLTLKCCLKKFSAPQKIKEKARIYKAEFHFIIFGLLSEDLDKIAVGDIMDDGDGQKIAEIKELMLMDFSSRPVNFGPNNRQTIYEEGKKQLKAKITLWGEMRDNEFYFNDGLIKLDKVVEFDFSGFKVEAYLLNVIPGRSEEKIDIEFSKTEFDFVLIGANPALLYKISAGSTMEDEFGRKIAEIKKVYQERIDTKQAKIRIIFWGVFKDNDFYFNGEPLLLDKKIKLNFSGDKVQGYIIQTIKAAIEVKFNSLSNELMNLIAPGDIGYTASASMPSFIAKIKNILKTEKHQTWIIDNAKFTQITHPELFDLTIAIEINCSKFSEDLIFGDQTVKVGRQFIFATDNYEITGNITSLERK